MDAVAKIWRLTPPGPSNLWSSPAFVHLREVCQILYPAAGSEQSLGVALDHALRALGLPSSLSDRARHQVLPAEVAATRLDAAFRRTVSARFHLCPLDCADDLPTLRFGPNEVRRFSAAELDQLIDPIRLQRVNPAWTFDSQRFSQFTWLLVKEEIQLDGEPGARAVPVYILDFNGDFGRIHPHQLRVPRAVECALCALLLAPWEDWVQYCDVDWRGFHVPWVYTFDDDLFVRPTPPPDPGTLSWAPAFYRASDGQEFEGEAPLRLPLSESAVDASLWVNDSAWVNLQMADQSPLFETPIVHFIARAFLSEGIDEFLAHITVVEAALGLKEDYDRRGATSRVAARLSGLLNTKEAGNDFRRLFNARSEFLHGRPMNAVSGKDRILARSIARRTVAELVGAVTENSAQARTAYLEKLHSIGLALT